MAQEFNLEVIPGMEELTTRLEEDLIPAFRMVKDEIVEVFRNYIDKYKKIGEATGAL